MDIEIHTPTGILYPLDKFSYTKQAGDIGDVETSAANHTNSFTVRNDNETIRVLEGLSLIGSTSMFPYRKNPSSLIVDNYTIMKSGWLQVERSNRSTFKMSMISGNADFWKLIEGLSLGDIDLSETVHKKTVANIVASFTNDYYKYILANYGVPNEDPDVWNGDFLVPSINEQYVFDRIFQHIQMEKEMSVEIDTWLTYPKDVYDEAGYVESLKFTLDAITVVAPVQLNEKIQPEPASVVESVDAEWDLPTYKTTILTDGVYKISHSFTSMKVVAVFRYNLGFGETNVASAQSNGFMQIYVNGAYRGTLFYNDSEININLFNGDLVEFVFSYHTSVQYYSSIPLSLFEILYLNYYRITDYEAKIERRNLLEISFADAFRDITAKDFVKYIMMRYGLTLFVEDNKATFLTVDERLNAPAQDLSDFVREKKEEAYIYPNYAVKNAFRHKYINESDDFQDGYIYASDNIMQDTKTLFESFTFSRMPDDSMPVFEAEVKKSGGDVIIEYKSILGRFFSLRYKMVPDRRITVFTEKIPASTIYIGDVAMAEFALTTFSQFVPAYWQQIERLLKRAKLMKFTFDLSLPRFMVLDLKQRVYLEQEASYFLINKATLKEEGNVEIELIKID